MPPTTMRTALVRGLRVPVGFAVGAAVTLAVGTTAVGVVQDRVVVDTVVEDTTPGEQVERGRVARLMAAHGCWSGEAPPDVEIPGHVVLTQRVDGVLVTSYGGERLVGRALEALFGEGDDRVVTVHGFCR